MSETITGQDIDRLTTIGSMYANDNIVAYANGEEYRMNVGEVLKLPTEFAGVVFKVIKKRKHKYLEVNV